mmetsp:Transcript_81622/g.210150  ORF Transcript_81622/g.210150 Transcript_81622/m.210150 type:complete len:413 (+) Transcript_81622:1224-2462(+)
MRELGVLVLQLVAESHVGEHGGQLLDRLLAALHLQLCDEGVLRVVGHGVFVQQPPREVALIEVQEDVLVLQVRKQADHLAHQAHHLVLIPALQPLLQLQVAEQGEVLGAPCVLVEGVLKATISCLLEPRVVLEAPGHHVVQLGLELQHPLDVRRGIVDHLLVVHNPGTPLLYVRLHEVGHVRQHGWLAPEELVHERELVVLFVVVHGLAARLHLHQLLGRVQDELALHHGAQLLLGRAVQVLAKPLLLVLQPAGHLLEEQRAGVLGQPARDLRTVEVRGAGEQRRLEVHLVAALRVRLPHQPLHSALLLDDLGLRVPHRAEHLNQEPDHILVDVMPVSLAVDRIDHGGDTPVLAAIVDGLLKCAEGSGEQVRILVVVFGEESVEVLEDALHPEHQDGALLPQLCQRLEQLLP